MTFARSLFATVALVALAACGREAAPPAAPETPATAPAAPAAPVTAPAATGATAVVVSDAGKSVYGKTCAMCHAAGVAGAPKPGDKAAWAPRIAQGNDVLYKHAIEGFTGSLGMMPPKGGGMSLSDDEVKAAVDHMVALSK